MSGSGRVLAAALLSLAGHEAEALGDTAGASAHFREALDHYPRAVNAWVGMGTCLFREGEKRSALSHYARASSILPSSTPLLCYLGMTHGAVGETGIALEVFRRAEALAPGNLQVGLQRAWVLCGCGQSMGAYKELERVADTRPKDAAVLIQLGKMCVKLGRVEEAGKWFNAALEVLTPPAGILGGAIAMGPGATAAAAAAAGGDKARNAVRTLLASLVAGGEGGGGGKGSKEPFYSVNV